MPAWVEPLLDWYSRNARQMPWRDNPQPYPVWVSEIMLQQTRVDTVLPYFTRWMQRFPTIQDLAKADLQEVLNTWEGLGYYSRARNLHRAARIVVSDFGGCVPHEVNVLKKLPGIGPYTAGAIASLAFGLDEPVVDGNIRRVLARLEDVEFPVDTIQGARYLWEIARENLPSGRAGEYNQALMELGALICLPRQPLCNKCPVRIHCKARARNVQEQRPILKPRQLVPHYHVTAAVLRRLAQQNFHQAQHHMEAIISSLDKEEVLLARRPLNGLLGGMWEFPGGKVEPGEDLEACLKREIWEELGVIIEVGSSVGIFRHAYTHFKVTLHAFTCYLVEGEPRPIQAAALAWVSLKDLPEFPMGKLDRQIAKKISEAALL